MSNSTTLIDQISSTQAAKEVVVNANFDAASPAMLWGRRASTTAGLTWGYFGGTYYTSSGANAVANGTVTLTASATNYVYASATTGAVAVNTAGFPAGSIPLYQIVTGASAVNSYTDERSFQPSAVSGPSYASQEANYVFAGPTSGDSAAPTWRQLVGADLPVFGASGSAHAPGAVPDPGSTSGSTRFLREDGSWAVPAGGGGGSGGMANPMTADGDLIVGGSDGAPLRLGAGTSGQVLTVVSGVPAWAPSSGGGTSSPFGESDTAPALSNFTWVNQGSSAVATQRTGYISLTDLVASSGQFRALVMAAPATPYKITARMRGLSYENYHGYGICFYDSTTGEAVTAGPIAGTFQVYQWNSPTSSKTQLANLGQAQVDWIRLRDDGTNVYVDISCDGYDFLNIWSASRTAYLSVPGNVGFFALPNSAPALCSLNSWLQS